MAQTTINGFVFTIRDNGKVDFSKPPAGKKFVPVPADEDYIRLKGIDRRFVTTHKFSATRMLVVMELVDEEEAAGAAAYIADIKAECQREERKNRCKIRSPKTGREIYCPAGISCYSENCPMRLGLEAEPDRPECLDDMAETVKSGSSVEDEVIAKIMWDDFRKLLRKEVPVLADILEWDEYGFTAAEIMKKLGRRTDETSWYYYQWKRIRKRWMKYNED